ncbi:hypothetical protein FORC77_3872 [Vibrio vulnificus]|nr:hypothetical protein FORC77_3872 [Vibrio vulnificus]
MMTYPIRCNVSLVAISSNSTILIKGVSLALAFSLMGKRPSETQSMMVRLGMPEN